MKLQSYTLAILVILLFAAVSCTKKEVEPTDNQLTGTWALVQKKITKTDVTTDLPLSKAAQILIFSSSDQLRSTVVEGDTILANASYYRVGYSDWAGPYLEVKKTSNDTQSRSYLFGIHSTDAMLYITDYDVTSQSNIVYVFRRQ